MSSNKEDKQIQQRNFDHEEKPLNEEQQVYDDKEKNKQVPEHKYLKPSASGIKNNEFPMISIFAHLTLLVLLAIQYFVEQQGIQFESFVGDIPSVFKVKPVFNEINQALRQWKEKWIDISCHVSSYHYALRNVHGQKRRSKSYSSHKLIKLDYLTCEDISTDCYEFLKKDNIYIITKEVIYSYGNEKVQQDLDSKINQILEEGEKADKFADTEMIIKLRDIQDDFQQLVYIRRNSFLINKLFFWLTSLLLLTIPYRLYVNSKTAHLNYKIHKRIYA